MTTDEFYDELFDELYTQAVPGTSEIESTEYPDTVNMPTLHWLDEDSMLDTIHSYADEYDLEGYETEQVKRAVVLGKGPSTNRSGVDRRRQEIGLKTTAEILDGDPWFER